MELVPICQSAFEVIVLWIVFYQIYRAFKGSKAMPILASLAVIILAGWCALKLLDLKELKWLVGALADVGIFLVVLFQPELRTALSRIRLPGLFKRLRMKGSFSHEALIEKVKDSVQFLASKHYGALIVFSRNHSLSDQVKTGIELDASYSRELIGTIFMPKTLLHDGAVIVRHERVVAAAAILPVSNRVLADHSLGLRHRAGLGITEATDAVVVIVSEETGLVSLAVGGKMMTALSLDQLTEELKKYLDDSSDTETGQKDLH